jgi:hypothetical protein
MKFILNRRVHGRRFVVVLVSRPTGGGRPGPRLLARPPAPCSMGSAAWVGAPERLTKMGGRYCRATSFVVDPMWQSTRAITIVAPPEDVWPWIVQMGFPSHRAGWYTPHWLDRLSFGIKQRSADRIVPELQQLAVGDRVPDSDDWSVFFTVEVVAPPHALVLHSTRHVIKTIDFSWAFVIRELRPGESRLVIRARTNYTPRRALPSPCLTLLASRRGRLAPV